MTIDILDVDAGGLVAIVGGATDELKRLVSALPVSKSPDLGKSAVKLGEELKEKLGDVQVMVVGG